MADENGNFLVICETFIYPVLSGQIHVDPMNPRRLFLASNEHRMAERYRFFMKRKTNLNDFISRVGSSVKNDFPRNDSSAYSPETAKNMREPARVIEKTIYNVFPPKCSNKHALFTSFALSVE